MVVTILYCLLILQFSRNVVYSSEEPPVPPEVKTPLGRVRGEWKVTYEGNPFSSFEGIPYAKPPVNDLRFEDPQPYGPWEDTWQANERYTCLQNARVERGDEDCLYLNIYVPGNSTKPKTNLDVIVYIHGGGFMVGNGHQGVKSQYIMDREFIVITINYRLGILGFLSTEDEAIPGNMGLKDQVLALKWVKENIASFGGNPDSVTVSGSSAGAASTHLHYFSPLSKGLFVRGISHSGTALDPWAIRRKPLEKARKLGAMVGCKDGTTQELKRCLKDRPALQLLAKQRYFFGYGQVPLTPFAPVIEKHSKNPFLAEEPYTMLKQKKVLDVPWIVSICADDGLLPSAWYYSDLPKFDKKWSELAHYVLDYNDTLPLSKREAVAKQIRDFYLGREEPISEKNFKTFSKIFTDRLFAVGAETSAKLQSEANSSPVYYYYFNYGKGANKGTNLFSDKDLEGVGHGEDGIHFYGFLLINEPSESDKKLKTVGQNMLYSYASTGVPSFDGTDTWKPTENSKLTYLNITDAGSIKLNTVDALTPVEFWRSVDLLEFEKYSSIKDEL